MTLNRSSAPMLRCETCGKDLYELGRTRTSPPEQRPGAEIRVEHHRDGLHTVKLTNLEGWVVRELLKETP